MRVLVTVKSVLDPFQSPSIDKDGVRVDVSGKKHCMNPYDEVALERALQLKDQGHVTQVIALTFGEDEQVLRTALALGADAAVMFKTTTQAIDPFLMIQEIAHIVEEKDIDLVFMGKQTTDFEGGILPSMLAEALGWPEALNAYSLSITGKKLEVVSEADEGLEAFELSLPAVVSADLRLATPRFVSMPKLIQARRVPIEVYDVQLVENKSVKLVDIYEQKIERKQQICENVDVFAQKLKEALKDA